MKTCCISNRKRLSGVLVGQIEDRWPFLFEVYLRVNVQGH